MMKNLKAQVLIIGAGITGTGIARDLALRSVDCIVVQEVINAGASGANHGLIHTGGRQVSPDPGFATECREEAELLKRLAPDYVEETCGL